MGSRDAIQPIQYYFALIVVIHLQAILSIFVPSKERHFAYLSAICTTKL